MQPTLENHLPSEWQTWLIDNLERGCDPADLAKILQENGFDKHTITLKESHFDQAQSSSQAMVLAMSKRPNPDTSANEINIDGQRITIAMVLDQPHIVVYHHVLSEQECDALCASADQSFVQATVVDENDGSHQQHPHRISEHTCFTRGQTELIATIEQRIAKLVGWPIDHAEGMQVLRYQTGGEYRAHYDYFDPQLAGSQRHLAEGGQRVGTVLMYLSDVETGGGTRFPDIQLEVRPRKGSAVYFASVHPSGNPDPQSLHAGVPVVRGVKYAATKWLREQAHRPSE